MDHEQIKALAQTLRCNSKDLIALTPNNDPFLAGVPHREQKARWFADLWNQYGWGNGVHLRRLHYLLVSSATPILKADGLPYLNTENDWKYIATASLAARYLKLIPTGAMVDRRNPEPVIHATNDTIAGAPARFVRVNAFPSFAFDLPEPPDDTLPTPGFLLQSIADGQPYLVELWIEKTTMNDVLMPLARRLGVNVVAGAGETSEILARQAIERAINADRPMRIFYISDFDPGGRSMPVGLARKLEYVLHDTGLDLDITLQPIALTPEQCEQYRLPRTPLKETERRAARFEERFGEGATELDALEALHPGALAQIVEREVCRYIDPTLASRCSAARLNAHRKLVDIAAEISEPYWEAIASIEARYSAICEDVREVIDRAADEMQQLEADAAPLWRAIADKLDEAMPDIELEVPLPRAADPVAEPLFDSSRSYLEQLDHYRDWQGR